MYFFDMKKVSMETIWPSGVLGFEIFKLCTFVPPLFFCCS